MYISNLIQPDGRTLTRNIFSNHRLSPCAKAIGALLLILSSTAALANVDAVKKTHIQEIKHTEDLRLLQQMREMKEHSQYLQNDLDRVNQELYQKRPRVLDMQQPPTQEVKNLEERRMYLQRQIDQQNAQFWQLQKLIESRQPPRTEEDIHKSQIPPIKPIQFKAQSKKDHSDVTNITGLTEVVATATEIVAAAAEFIEYAKEEQKESVENPAYYKQRQQMQEMKQHFKYLENDLAEVRQKLQQKMEEGIHGHPEVKNLEEREKYLQRQIDQHNEQMMQQQELIDHQRLQKLQDEHVQNQQSESREQKNFADKSNTSKETAVGAADEIVTEAVVETGAGAKAEATAKPEANAKAVATTKPETEVKAEATAKPEANAKAVATAKPEANAKAVATTKPEANVKAVATAKPEANVKAVATAKPEANTKAEATAKPEANTKAEATTKPEANAKAEATAKPEANTKAEATAKPEANTKAEATAKPEANTKAEATAKPEANTKAEATAKPEANAKAEATAKPDAKAKTAKKASSSPQKMAPSQAPKVVAKPAFVISHNPQAGSYIANQITAQQMFITVDLQYRQGETRYIDPVTGEEKVTSLWINTSGGKNRFSSGNGQLRTKSNRYAIQLGGTLTQWSSGGDDKGILGIIAGAGKSTNHSHSTSSHHQAQGSVDGYNLGLYSIWYADNQTRLGPYIDLLTQYGWFNNQVKAQQVISSANYKSYVFTNALETGHKVQLFETADARLFIQPKAKISWQRMSGIQHKGAAGTLAMIEESNAVATTIGIRTALELDFDTLSSNKTLQLSPSFEANWIHSGKDNGVWLGSTNITPQGTNNIADLKLGIEANIDSNLRLWTHLGHQLGGHNYSDMQVTLGANYRF